MADDALIRRINLRRVVRARGLNARDLSQQYYGRYSYWRDLLEDDHKSFGEKAARRIEEAMHLPRTWLDQDGAPLPSPEPLSLREPAPAMAPARWPWSASLWAAVALLDDDQLEQCERLLRVHLCLPMA